MSYLLGYRLGFFAFEFKNTSWVSLKLENRTYWKPMLFLLGACYLKFWVNNLHSQGLFEILAGCHKSAQRTDVLKSRGGGVRSVVHPPFSLIILFPPGASNPQLVKSTPSHPLTLPITPHSFLSLPFLDPFLAFSYPFLSPFSQFRSLGSAVNSTGMGSKLKLIMHPAWVFIHLGA